MTSPYATQYKRAQELSRSIIEHAREVCTAAGLDGSLLGIHPHNAMVSFDAGKPWPGVDYDKVRLCLWLMEESHKPFRLLDAWVDSVRARYADRWQADAYLFGWE